MKNAWLAGGFTGIAVFALTQDFPASLAATMVVTATFVLTADTLSRRKQLRTVAPEWRDPDVEAVNHGVCPDCGGDQTLLAGPSGGMSVNAACNACLMEFNVHIAPGYGAFKVDRTGKMSEDRAMVFGIEPEEYRAIQSKREGMA